MDTYQAIYDAVRSRIGSVSAHDVLTQAAYRAFDLGHACALLQEQIGHVGIQMTRPSVLYRPSLYPDGTAWCALYGRDLMEGVAGFGATPEEAMVDFDQNWLKSRTPKAKHIANTSA